MKKLLFLGYGYVARRLAPLASAAGVTLAGTIRAPALAGEARGDGVRPVLWGDADAIRNAIGEADAILISTPPSEAGCPAARAARECLVARREPPRWIGYLSTNGVYGDHQGALVDETSPLRAASARARQRVAAENDWRAIAASIKAPLVIFRLPGIYGPGRSAFDALRAGRAQRIVKKGQVFSRAHVDDIAAALAASLADPRAGELFNIADDEPAPPQDVITHAAALLGVTPPPLIAFEDAALSDMARSFYADNKRVSNERMKARLTPRLHYPTYREGLAAILAQEALIARRLPG